MILLLLTEGFPATAQSSSSPASGAVRLSDWQTYSALTNVRAVSQDSRGTIWAATSGGVFSYSFTSKQLQSFRNIDALIGLDITAIGVAPTDEVYAGGMNGIVNVFDGVKWSPITDIFTANIARKRVTSMVFRDSLLFLGGEFGLVIYNTRQKVFFETVTRIGTLPASVPVRRLLLAHGRVWVGTDEGLASAPSQLNSFVNPVAWTVHSLQGVGTSTAITGLAAFQGNVIIGAGNGLWQWISTTATISSARQLRSDLQGTVNDLAVAGGNLFFGLDTRTGSRIFRIESPHSTQQQVVDVGGAFINALAGVDSLGVQTLVTASTNGLLLSAGGTTRTLVINSPAANRFREIALDARGALWCVNGTNLANPNVNNDGVGSGIYRLANGLWTNFTASAFPQLRGDSYYQIYGAPDSSVWASSWGNGLARFQIGDSLSSPAITRFDTTNSRLRGLGNFIAAGAVRTDVRTGTLWISNFTSDSITAFDRQGRFSSFARPASFRTCDYVNYSLMTIDGNGTKWIGKGTSQVLWAFNDRNTLNDPSDDQWQCLPSSITSSCTALVTDNVGEVWVGTKQGLYRIVTPFNIFGTSPVIVSAVQDNQIGRLTMNGIAVDAQNNKWLATNSGVWVVSPDGGDVLAQFNTDTSPLVSNNVLSIAIDNNTGRAYFGTDNGLSSAQTLAVKPNTDFSALRCYPQPFVHSEDTELVIDGLADNAQIKITTLDGTLVRTINVTSSRVAIWDGRDTRNQVVNSGVYIVSAFSSVGGGITGAVKAVVLQQR